MTIQEAVEKFKQRIEESKNDPRVIEMLEKFKQVQNEKEHT